MRRGLLTLAAVGLWLVAHSAAAAATVDVAVTSEDGRPAANAVVELVPAQPAAASIVTSVPAEAVVDQRKETFLPIVSVIRKGGRVIFTNNDSTMHQVYSFSDIKQFAFEIDEGQKSAPVVFEKAGVAAIGCNIHDQMITYVYVAAAPWAARTDTDGHARIAGVPAGSYLANVWHPQLAPGKSPPSKQVAVTGESARLDMTIALSPADPRGKKRAHMQMY